MPNTEDDAEWDARLSSMVDALLENDGGDGGVGIGGGGDSDSGVSGRRKDEGGGSAIKVDPVVLEGMMKMCMDQLHAVRRSMRKSELGCFLKARVSEGLGCKYQKRWLKVVIDALEDRRLVSTTPWYVTAVRGGRGSGKKWCHYFDCCKFTVNVSAHAKHFDSFLHLCPLGTRCRHLTGHVLGRALTEEGCKHFERFKHVCPQGVYCIYLTSPEEHRDHFKVFTHRQLTWKDGCAKDNRLFPAAMPGVRDDVAQHAADGGHGAC